MYENVVILMMCGVSFRRMVNWLFAW